MFLRRLAMSGRRQAKPSSQTNCTFANFTYSRSTKEISKDDYLFEKPYLCNVSHKKRFFYLSTIPREEFVWQHIFLAVNFTSDCELICVHV